MSLKILSKKQLDLFCAEAVSYRLSMSVTNVLVLSNGDSYPVCPRCNTTMEWEYMCFCDRCGQRLGWEHYDSAKVVHAPFG